MLARPEGRQVRLVPDLEEPLPHFVEAVTVDPMLHELADEHRPLRGIARRRDVGAVMKDDLLAGRQRSRHEAQLDERLHADREQVVENLVGIEERIEQLAALIDQRAHVVRKDAVKPHMLHSEFGMRALELPLPVRTQTKRCVPAADRMLPEMRKWCSGTVKIADECRCHVDQSWSCRAAPDVDARVPPAVLVTDKICKGCPEGHYKKVTTGTKSARRDFRQGRSALLPLAPDL